jgi:hypothetical protein
MIKHGILFQGIFCPHYSHTEQDVKDILEAMDAACKVYKMGLHEGYSKYLIGEPIKPVFRKTI